MSRAYIYYKMGGLKDRFKCLLPLVAYYFNTGPWRNMWVRLGYDPRADPAAWRYQIIDYRTRSAGVCRRTAGAWLVGGAAGWWAGLARIAECLC